MDVEPAPQIAGALAPGPILDDIPDGERDERDKGEVQHGEGEPGGVPPAGLLQHRPRGGQEVGGGGADGQRVEADDDEDALVEEAVEVGGQQGVALLAVGGLEEAGQEPVLIPAVHERRGAAQQRRHAQQLQGVAEQAGCHGDVDKVVVKRRWTRSSVGPPA